MKIPLLLTLMALGATMIARGSDAKPTVPQLRIAFDKLETESLAPIYKETLAKLDKTEAAALRKKEAAWVEFRGSRAETMAKAAAGGKGGKPENTADYWKTMIEYTEQRIEFLKAYTGKNVSPGINGDYTDSVDGDLQLEERQEGLFFTFSVVRGNTLQAGQLTGIAQRDGDKAHFKGEAADGEKGPACELEFTIIDGHIVRVKEISPDPDAGKGVHYDGDYYKKADAVIHD